MRAQNHHWDNGVSPLLGFGDHDDDDEEGEPAEEPAEEENPGEDVDFGESEEAAEPKVVTKPCKPSAAEVEAHNATHIPFRNWCEICVRGRAQDMGHASKPKEASGVPKVLLDYGYTRDDQGKRDELITCAGKPILAVKA